MTRTVQGIYRDGAIELLETPDGVQEGRVTVTLKQSDVTAKADRPLICGKYRDGRFSTEEDFKSAEWHGEKEFDGD